jgi:hypothetical protein
VYDPIKEREKEISGNEVVQDALPSVLWLFFDSAEAVPVPTARVTQHAVCPTCIVRLVGRGLCTGWTALPSSESSLVRIILSSDIWRR